MWTHLKCAEHSRNPPVDYELIEGIEDSLQLTLFAEYFAPKSCSQCHRYGLPIGVQDPTWTHHEIQHNGWDGLGLGLAFGSSGVFWRQECWLSQDTYQNNQKGSRVQHPSEKQKCYLMEG